MHNIHSFENHSGKGATATEELTYDGVSDKFEHNNFVDGKHLK